jgi:two-component system, sensor histidine kinase YesM
MILTYLLSYIFYNPLKKIVSAMQMIENRNLDVRINDNRADEYHKVYKGFNNMVTELNSLIRDLVNEKILKKEAQIKLLQAQINPHFLYNTLESIHSIAKIKKVDEISSMVSALSKFFRISLSGGKDDVTLSEAIELVLNYLTIQNIRFNGKIDYQINIPEELRKAIVPKLILQPVAENSIYHGIEQKKGIGILIISALSQKGEMELIIEDNGIGINEKNLLELRNSIENGSFEDSRNFALKNLNRQIKLKYGINYGLKIESVEGNGTSVHIKLPIIYERGVW